MKVTKITLVFENVEAVEIGASYVKRLVLDGVTENVSSTLNDKKEMEIQTYKNVSRVYLVIDKEADKYYDNYGVKSDITIFERIQRYSDITNIILEYENGAKTEYVVPWNGTIMDEENIGEQHQINKDGSLCIVIESFLPKY